MVKAIAAALVLFVSTTAAEAQFGRNKVQYDRFAFTVLETPHFHIHYYAGESDAAQIAARLAERWYERLSIRLAHTFDRPQPIILYSSHAHFTQTSILPDDIPEGVGGFTDHRAGRVVLPFAAGLGETDHVLGHEIVHAFQRDILRKQGQSLTALPLWFAEGMAEYVSLDEIDTNTWMWLRDAVANDKLPKVAQLGDPRWFPYRYGQALWAFVAATYGERVVVEALHVRRAKDGISRLEQATGEGRDTLTTKWHAFIRSGVGEISKREPTSHRILGAANSGRLNVGPALSPDGRLVVFLSERDQYAIDVFVADAASGKIVRKLLNTATDAHFDSLQFAESAGAWDPSGHSFVLATIRDGHPVLTIFDMPQGTVRRAIAVPELDQIFTPTWSPDGRRLAFTGVKGGLTDLYLLSVDDGVARSLTHDAYSDLQPTWSPDGRRIAFTTDRFSSSIDTLEFGKYQLASVDVDDGAIVSLGGVPGGKSIDPHWSADGRALYFIADASGVSNVYRLDLESMECSPVTDTEIGVSGITSLSPAISLGAHGNTLAATMYANGVHEIHLIDLDAIRDGAPVTQATRAPHTPVRDGELAAAPFPRRPYNPRLSLLNVGEPYVSSGTGPFGTFLRAGISMSLSDLLVQQELIGAVQVGNRALDLAAEVTYLNRRSRWNWGLVASQVPWQIGGWQTASSAISASGDTIVLRDSVIEQQQHRQGAALLVYPVSRARRIELSSGIEAVRFDRQVSRASYTPFAMKPFDRTTFTEKTAANAVSFVGGAAFVHDTSVFGVASPILGKRYRVGLSTSVGDLSLATANVDFRQYRRVFDAVTFAARVQHVARLGPDASDLRLLPIVWSAREVVRGFDQDLVTERAVRMTSANLEARFPLGRLLGPRKEGLIPVEVFAFADAAHFADRAGTATGPITRDLMSAGWGARVGVAGLAFELNAVRPVTPSAGWRFAVNLRPGF